MIRRPALVLLVLSALIALPAQGSGSKRLVLAIGANDGGPDRPRLRYANSDARALAKVMVDLGGVATEDATVLIDADPARFHRAIKALVARVKRMKRSGNRVEVVVYYSGHSDEEGLLLGQAKVPYSRVRKAVKAIPADVRLAIVDSCAAGALTRTKGGKRRAPFLLDSSTSVTGHAFLTSSSEDEVAQESDRVGGSFFTHYLVSGLCGAADVSRDGRVTLAEVYRFAYDETLARTERTRGGPQHAAYDIQLAGTGDLVLTDLRATSARLRLSSELHGTILVRDAKGKLAAEVRKTRGRSVTLGLGPGTYTVTAHQKKKVLGARVKLGRGSRTWLRQSDLRPVALETAMARGSNEGGSRGDTFPPGSGQEHPPEGPVEIVIEQLVTVEPTAPADERVLVPFNAALLPTLSINGGREDVVNHFAINVLAGYGDELLGLELAIGANVRGSLTRGAQLALGANFTSGAVYGYQGALAYNHAGWIQGVQTSLAANYAGGGTGAQFGAVNIAGDLTGGQFGLVNIGGDVKGVQVGLINYAQGSDAPLGLLNIVLDGLHEVSVVTSDLHLMNVHLRLGGRYFYNLLSAGFHPRGGKERHAPLQWSFGAGFGIHTPITERLWMAYDISAHKLMTSPNFDLLNLVTRLRVQVGFQVAAQLAVVGGITGNTLLSYDFQDTGGLGYGAQTELAKDGDLTVSIWPGFFVGLEI